MIAPLRESLVAARCSTAFQPPLQGRGGPRRWPMRLRRLLNDRAVNSLLLLTVLALALTGVAGLFANAAGQRAVFYAHRIGGAALLVLLIPKAGIIARALRRPAARRAPGARGRLDLLASLLLLGATLVLLGAVLGW